MMKKSMLIIGLITLLTGMLKVKAQVEPLSEQMAATVMEIWQERPHKWSYDQGVVFDGLERLWRRTGKKEYFQYIQNSMDKFISEDGKIDSYVEEHFNIDNIKNGHTLLMLYRETGKQKYLTAATLLWEQLKKHPRTSEGGFWHKKIYPNQMWLDGLYMGQPFYAEYAVFSKNDQAFNDIANQFVLMEKNSVEKSTGLMYHGYDESRAEAWSNPKTGRSPHFWARAMGWYAMALVDVLDYFPENHPKRAMLVNQLKAVASALKKVQDPKSGVWYDILDLPNREGNYLESSASSMFVCAIAKGVRKKYLKKSYLKVARKGYEGLKKEFIEHRSAGKVNLKGTVKVSGLGGKPYRDGSFAYYMSEDVITNDPKGVGAFIMAANEMELAGIQ
ncbi:glycoside hydrolase family 88/105 protein [Pedobacter immunditicola]|uniref:glycoside hydrolase family 88/105 protein n=1 Tax=Pedobacter immunditicola TaxID=3133440 RepID=UPI0030963533